MKNNFSDIFCSRLVILYRWRQILMEWAEKGMFFFEKLKAIYTNFKWWHFFSDFFTVLLVGYFMPNILYWRWHWRSILKYSWLCWLQTKLKWRHFFTVPQVDYFMPPISDTGGDTDAQSQYSWLWLHSNSFFMFSTFLRFLIGSFFLSPHFVLSIVICAWTPERPKYEISLVYL